MFNSVAFITLITVFYGVADGQFSERISQKKCDEYAQLAQRVTKFASLALDSATHDLKKDKCDFSAGLIVDGVAAIDNEFPHMAGIGYRDSGDVLFFCGGSLISDRFVLTSAHCRRNDQLTPIVVRMGSNKLKSTERHTPAKDFEVESFIVHEQYDSRTKQNDIALIRLRNAVDFASNQRIRPACVWQSRDIIQEFGVASGWGVTSSGQSSNELMKVKLNFVPVDECPFYFSSNILSENQLCAGLSGKQDTCRGDSGGPLQVVSASNRCVWVVVGITSYGNENCGTAATPSVYTRVSSYLDWIEAIVWP